MHPTDRSLVLRLNPHIYEEAVEEQGGDSIRGNTQQKGAGVVLQPEEGRFVSPCQCAHEQEVLPQVAPLAVPYECCMHVSWAGRTSHGRPCY